MNYNLVIDTSNFKPFDMSYDLQILNGYRDRYQRYEDILNKIAEENGQYVLPDTVENKQYNDTLKAFNEDFKAASDDFSNGMNNRNAAAIMDIYRRSRREITPINKAIEAYNKGVDKINALGPDAIIGNKDDLSKISSYYGGANPIIDYRSGKQIEQDSINYFQGINNSLMQDAEFNRILGGQYFERVQEGIDSGTALAAALTDYNNRTNGRHSEAVQNLIGHMQHIMDSEGVERFSEDAKKQVWNKIASGLVASIEAPKYTTQANHMKLNETQQYALDQQKKEDAFKYKYDASGNITGWNADYLKGAYSSSGKYPKQPEEYEEVPTGGAFHPIASRGEEKDIETASEVRRSSVPSHIAAEYPEGTKFYLCKNKKGLEIGYKAITYKKVKKTASVEEIDESEGEQEE